MSLQYPVCKRCFESGHEASDCKEEKENFDLIVPIAAFIGARLQYLSPNINGQGNPWVSTIKVDQHKEKFWYVRVYCDLADPSLVQKKWEFLKDRHRRHETGKKFYWWPRESLHDMLGAHGDEAPAEFLNSCMLHDAIHYRMVYMDAVRLRPHLRSRICDQADYNILLKECINHARVRNENLDLTCEQFHVSSEVELKEFLQKVYKQTFHDTMELHD